MIRLLPNRVRMIQQVDGFMSGQAKGPRLATLRQSPVQRLVRLDQR